MNLPCRREAEHHGRGPPSKFGFQIFFSYFNSQCRSHVWKCKASSIYFARQFHFTVIHRSRPKVVLELTPRHDGAGLARLKPDRQFHYSSTGSFYGSLKSSTYSCVSITLSASS